ncbi:hypothetical protein MNBD_GAMMA07-1309 [hydrothermal vent metagenome]|uniref:DNA polymerase III chi subunit n=1 Tax=hydrothermal vent metagenome TaxID=652676 RepID=A0A3B0WU76_9ZZZZ
MTCVNFYILPDNQITSLQQYACRLAENHWLSGKRVLIQTDSSTDSESLDERLWSARDNSFIPHAIATLEPIDQQQPILISHLKINDQNFQSVINLSSRQADIMNQKLLVIDEILNQDEQRKVSGRQNYKSYRAADYTLKHHTLENLNE